MNHQQIVKNPPLKAGKGILVVVGLLAALFLVSAVSQLLAPVIGSALSSLLFWGAGVAAALWTMRRYVLAYSYAVNSNTLQVTFAYGRYRRLMEEIYFNNMYRSGAPDALKQRYPGAHVHRATRPGCEYEEFAVAYRSNGKTDIIVLQPDETLKKILIETTKKK